MNKRGESGMVTKWNGDKFRGIRSDPRSILSSPSFSLASHASQDGHLILMIFIFQF